MTAWRRNGILFVLLSDLVFGFLPITVKWANQWGYGSVQVAFCRFAFALLGIALLVTLNLQPLRISNLQALFWRGFFGGITVLLYFITLQETTAAKATLFNYTYALWTNVFAVLFFKVKPPKGFGLLLAVAAVGVWLVLGVSFSSFEWGDLTGLLSGMAAGASVLAVKEARRTDNALSIFASFSWFGFLIAGGGLLLLPHLGFSHADWTGLSLQGGGLLALMGFLAMAAQMLFTYGYGYVSLAAGSLLSLLVPVLTAFFSWEVLKEPLTPHFILGTCLVLVACGLISLQEQQDKPAEV